MPFRPLPLVVFFVLLAAACTTWDRQHYVGHDRLVIGKQEREGVVETYLLEVGAAAGEATLTVRSEFERQRAFLGLQVAELDRVQAEPRGVLPYRGLLVTGTWPRSAAEAAGIRAGDIVLAIGAEALAYRDHLTKAEVALRPEQPVTIKLLRDRVETELQVTPRAQTDLVVEPEPIALEKTAANRPYAGVVLRGIPRAWCERMFGAPRNAVVIAGVDVGSPAWTAGFRAGDVIERVDGAPVGTVDEVAQSIRERGRAGGSMALQVRRGLDQQFDASLALSDYSGEKQVWFPLVFRVQDGARQDRWSVGPLGLLVNNTNTYEDDPPGRQAPTRNVFDALFGLVHVESSSREQKLRLLWFITIDV